MDPFYLSIGSIVLSCILGLLLARHNLKELIRTKPQRLEARRAEKKLKNERLRKFYGLDKK